MTYVSLNDDRRPEIDLARFAADLAKVLGGTVKAPDPERDWPNQSQTIVVDGNEIGLTAKNYKRPPYIVACISAPDVKWDDRNTYNATHRTESACVNPDGRTIERIAKDIKRRVIDASQGALKLQREYAAQQIANRASIVERAAALKKRMPALSVRVNEREQNATLYNSEPYVSATLAADGKVRIERIDNMTAEQFEQVMAVLETKGETV